jgi:hypothetical protein
MMPTWLDETRRQNSTKFLVWEFFQFFVSCNYVCQFFFYSVQKFSLVKSLKSVVSLHLLITKCSQNTKQQAFFTIYLSVQIQ